MFTTCPKCALTLAVTAADLRAGQGYVRCGRCANVFNALLGLAEESASGTTPTPAAVRGGSGAISASSSGAAAAAEPSSAPATASPALHAVESPPPHPASSQATEVAESRGTGTFETIVLEGDTVLQTEEMVTAATFDDEIAAVSRRIAAAHELDEQDEEIIDFADTDLQISAQPAPAPAKEWRSNDMPRARRRSLSAPSPQPDSSLPQSPHPGSQRPDNTALEQLLPARAALGWKIIAGVSLCAVLLAMQLMHHWRNDLATHQALAGPLGRLYSALHQPLAPNWNLAAYDVRQLGASSDASDQRIVRVRLSLSNHAPAPQAVPLLRISLLDRYGKRISAGELAPAQYLPAALRTRQLLDAEQRIDTEITVPDPTQQASSFELDVCIAAAGGGLRCAGDSAVLAANGVVS
jgi:predicted Zn finger-like uncharacterized protein